MEIFSPESESLALPERKIYTVSELTNGIRDVLEDGFASVWVNGEVSNFKLAPSGHMYFTLKDDSAQIRCVIFKLQNRFLKFKMADGLRVVCWGRVTVYGFRGEYQLTISSVEPQGLGGMMLAFEQLKAKLAAEGLFEQIRKKPIPRFPRTIGLVTSAKGAAVRDMIRNIHRRYPTANILVSGSSVQGDRAPAEIQEAIKRLCRIGNVDVLIVGRGGGSIEDLWAFNDERVIRAVAECPLPVISAVGHETDFTLTDLAADLRASTPSAAAELIVPDCRELQDSLIQLTARLRNCVKSVLEAKRSITSELTNRLYDPRKLIRDRRISLDELTMRLVRAMQRRIAVLKEQTTEISSRLRPAKLLEMTENKRAALNEQNSRLDRCGRELLKVNAVLVENLTNRLSALNPLAVLERGYSISFTRKTGKTITRAADVKNNSEIKVQLHQGALLCRVLDRRLDAVGADFEDQPNLLEDL